jgi:predicted nucleic acid-binding protein
MPFVLDASISATWALADESSPLAETAEKQLRDDFALVPRIWWYEIRNLLIINERRQRLTIDGSAAFLRLLSAYPIRVEQTEDELNILQLARRYRLSFYDAAYLALALRKQLPLATLDKALEAAAIAAGVAILA